VSKGVQPPPQASRPPEGFGIALFAMKSEVRVRGRKDTTALPFSTPGLYPNKVYPVPEYPTNN